MNVYIWQILLPQRYLKYFKDNFQLLHVNFFSQDLEKYSIGIWESCSSMEKDCDEIEFRYFLDTYQVSTMVKMMDFVCRKVRKSVKINQIPGQWILGRKDHFTRIYNEKRSRYKHLNFYPNTFVLPEDSERLLTFMTPEKLVLVKPPNWFSGLGIKLTNKIGDIRNMEK